MAALLVAAALPCGAAGDDLLTATKKVDAIKGGQLRAGARVYLSPRELNAWVRSQLPDGVRDATVRIAAPGVATGSAMVDVAKVCRAQGIQPGWALSKLLEGEHPVSVTVGIRSADGSATVDVKRAEISGLEIDGRTLDLLIQYVLLPLYPNAAVGRPFELGHGIERIGVRPAALSVEIGPKR
jgi:hypothetical protein